MPKLNLNPQPDGCGYYYGTYVDDRGEHHRANILPPAPAWRGDHGMKPSTIDPTKWLVFIGGEEVGRIDRFEDASAHLANAVFDLE